MRFDPKTGLTLLGTLLLVSCMQTVPVRPPAELLRDCEVEAQDFSTNAGLSRALIAYRASLGLCNADKRALRDYYKD